MKGWTVPVFLLLFYAFPYTFLAMYGDYAFGTVALYLPLAAALSVLCLLALRRGQPWLAAAGNLITFLSSRAFLTRIHGEGWESCFKPFTPLAFLTTVSLLALAVQAVWILFDRKKRAAFEQAPRPRHGKTTPEGGPPCGKNSSL